MPEGKDRIRQVEWLAQQLKEKEAIIDGISDTLMLLDARTYKIIEVNQAFLNSYGLCREEVLGKKCYEITHHLSIPCHHANSHCPCPVENTVATGNLSHVEHVHQDNDGMIIIEVKDTGTGIPESILDKIFDPFFTSKEVGKGTGLGLSISYSIVQNYNGTINVETEEGEGSNFIIRFPVPDEA